MIFLFSQLLLNFVDVDNHIIELDVLDVGYQQFCIGLFFGTETRLQRLQVSLSTPEISVLDASCMDSYAPCKQFCKNNDFCNIYCNPTCCIDKRTRDSACPGTTADGYTHDSWKFKVIGKSWRSATDKSVGIWVEDIVAVLNNRDYKSFHLGTISFALKVYDALYVDRSLRRQGEIGFGRDPAVPNFVELLYRHGHIPYPGLTIAYVVKLFPLYSLGEYRSDICRRDRKTVATIGEREWMFDASASAFFNYQSAVHDFRMILLAGGAIRMPRHVLLSFINSNLIMAHPQQYNFFRLSNTHSNDDFKFFFMIDPNFVLHSNLQSIGVPVFDNNYTTFIAEAIDPNPDKVEWVVGRTIFLNYCVFLDYRLNQISFSKLKRQ